MFRSTFTRLASLALVAISTRIPSSWADTTAGKSGNVAIEPADRLKEGWWKERFAKKQEDLKTARPDIVFLGDSITQGWEGQPLWDKLKEMKSFNLGYSGDRTEHVLWRIDNGEFDTIKPKVICILIGTNNIGHQSSNAAQTVEGMKAILKRLNTKQPQAKIIIQAVFPRADRPQFQSMIDEMNKGYAALADGKNIQYVDFSKNFLGAEGKLTREVMPDMLHLSAKGYEIWDAAIRPVIAAASK